MQYLPIEGNYIDQEEGNCLCKCFCSQESMILKENIFHVNFYRHEFEGQVLIKAGSTGVDGFVTLVLSFGSDNAPRTNAWELSPFSSQWCWLLSSRPVSPPSGSGLGGHFTVFAQSYLVNSVNNFFDYLQILKPGFEFCLCHIGTGGSWEEPHFRSFLVSLCRPAHMMYLCSGCYRTVPLPRGRRENWME